MIRPIALAAIALVVLASCSSTETASDPTTPADAAPTTPAPTDAVATDTSATDSPTTEVPAATASTPVPTTAAPTTTEAPTIRLTGPAVVSRPTREGVTPEGFTTTMVRITEADGTVCEVCMWLADDAGERARGLMGVTDLGAAAGMVFVFEQPVDAGFYMFGTVTPLSIAWFDVAGDFVSATDMDPCGSENAADCPTFAAGAPYELAIEVFAGDLDGLGIGPGSRAELIAGSETDGCPLDDG